MPKASHALIPTSKPLLLLVSSWPDAYERLLLHIFCADCMIPCNTTQSNSAQHNAKENDIAQEIRINEKIRAPQVRVIDENNEQLGVFSPPDAIALARERGLDLVEVAPTAKPPVCRLLDYDQFRYSQQKRDRENRKRQKRQEIKEVRLGVKIGDHDFETKIRRAGQFLSSGDRVKITVRFKGREITHPQLGRDLLLKAASMLEEHGSIERQPILEGKSLFLLMAPTASLKS